MRATLKGVLRAVKRMPAVSGKPAMFQYQLEQTSFNGSLYFVYIMGTKDGLKPGKEEIAMDVDISPRKDKNKNVVPGISCWLAG
jgi:hypothetical protein